ncbi:hypothetical protein ACA910_010421 [Epithemia clementina (nom. ined.)]
MTNSSDTTNTTPISVDDDSLLSIVQSFCARYDDPLYQERLNRLYASLGNDDPENWAKNLYLSIRDNNPTNNNDHATALNQDRKACLQLLYDLVNAWQASSDPRKFEEHIHHVFQPWRIQRILHVCLVMDRAQSLYRMQLPMATYYGMHWYCKFHLLANDDPNQTHATIQATTTSKHVVIHPHELAALKASLWDYPGSPAMNWRIFKVLYTDQFGLLNDMNLAKWCRPKLATFVKVTTRNAPVPDSAIAPKNTAQLQFIQTNGLGPDHVAIVQKYVEAYNDPEFQD